MTIANRSIMFQQEEAGWGNPYVTDGLVAMWDVEWNAGGGVHNPGSRQIVNLCGGAPIVLSQGVIVGNRSVTYTTVAANDYGGITDEMVELPLPGAWATNESVWWTNKTASWSVSNLAFLYRNGNVVVNNTNTGVGMGFYRNNETNFRCGTQYYNIGVLASLVSSTNQVRAWNDHVGYVNMTSLPTTSNLSIGTAFVDDARVRIMYSNAADAQFEFACLRIYNRSLSDSEIAANYAVDKSRFNLP